MPSETIYLVVLVPLVWIACGLALAFRPRWRRPGWTPYLTDDAEWRSRATTYIPPAATYIPQPPMIGMRGHDDLILAVDRTLDPIYRVVRSRADPRLSNLVLEGGRQQEYAREDAA